MEPIAPSTNRAGRRAEAKSQRRQKARNRRWRIQTSLDIDRTAKAKRIQKDHDAAHARAVERRKNKNRVIFGQAK